MKKYSLPRFTLALAFIVMLCTFSAKKTIAQSMQNENLKTTIESKNYGFSVTHDTNGNFATGNYYFNLLTDSLSVTLPYHGNSGTAAYTMDQNGINVHTKDFTYKSTPLKNGGYYIKIYLTGDRITRSLSLRVNKKGYALLTVESINRDPVSFSGVITNI